MFGVERYFRLAKVALGAGRYRGRGLRSCRSGWVRSWPVGDRMHSRLRGKRGSDPRLPGTAWLPGCHGSGGSCRRTRSIPVRMASQGDGHPPLTRCGADVMGAVGVQALLDPLGRNSPISSCSAWAGASLRGSPSLLCLRRLRVCAPGRDDRCSPLPLTGKHVRALRESLNEGIPQ